MYCINGGYVVYFKTLGTLYKGDENIAENVSDPRVVFKIKTIKSHQAITNNVGIWQTRLQDRTK